MSDEVMHTHWYETRLVVCGGPESVVRKEQGNVFEERDALRSQLREAVELLECANCPSHTELRCPWCDRRDLLLARIEGGAK